MNSSSSSSSSSGIIVHTPHRRRHACMELYVQYDAITSCAVDIPLLFVPCFISSLLLRGFVDSVVRCFDFALFCFALILFCFALLCFV